MVPIATNRTQLNLKRPTRFNRWLDGELLAPLLVTPAEQWVSLLTDTELSRAAASRSRDGATATLQVARVTEDFIAKGRVNAVVFGGIELGGGVALAPAPARSERQLVLIGDSDTAGYGTHGSPGATECYSPKLMWQQIEDTSVMWASQVGIIGAVLWCYDAPFDQTYPRPPPPVRFPQNTHIPPPPTDRWPLAATH